MKEKSGQFNGDFMDLIIVTGISGAGKSTVVHAMEDIGYFCIDNVPARLISVIAQSVIIEDKRPKAAIVTDVRAGLTPQDMEDALLKLRQMKISYKLLFVDCRQQTVLSRYRLARRAHPLCDDCIGISDAVSIEKRLMEPFKAMADYVFDTTGLSLNDCKNRVFDFFSDLEGTEKSNVKIRCVSFGFKHSAPEDADFIFDVRSLPNPYYIDELRELTGLDEKVSSFVMQSSQARQYEQKLLDFCNFTVPLCASDGRSQLVIAIGCTGGHHRSVTFAEILYKHLKKEGYNVSLNHRDIKK